MFGEKYKTKENRCGFSMEARETGPGLSVLAVSGYYKQKGGYGSKRAS